MPPSMTTLPTTIVVMRGIEGGLKSLASAGDVVWGSGRRFLVSDGLKNEGNFVREASRRWCRGHHGDRGWSQMEDLDKGKLYGWSALPEPKNCSIGGSDDEKRQRKRPYQLLMRQCR